MTEEAHRKQSIAVGRIIAAYGTRQHGVVSRSQLRAAGLPDTTIDSRLSSGVLQPLFHGVYSVGHRAVGRPGRMLGATLACGGQSVVSHGCAAELHGLWEKQPRLIDVIAPGSKGRKIDGIRWHRGHPLRPSEITSCDGVPCTTIPRTLVDMAGQLTERSLRRMVEQAAVLRALDVSAIERSLARGRRRGAPLLRLLLEPWRRMDAEPRLRRRTEARLLAAVVEAGSAASALQRVAASRRTDSRGRSLLGREAGRG
jgi:predicted transcriptional regulator of viral defense system